MKENYLPIFKASLDLVCYVDTIVKNQERYYKYSIGLELREEKVWTSLIQYDEVGRVLSMSMT